MHYNNMFHVVYYSRQIIIDLILLRLHTSSSETDHYILAVLRKYFIAPELLEYIEEVFSPYT